MRLLPEESMQEGWTQTHSRECLQSVAGYVLSVCFTAGRKLTQNEHLVKP